MRNVKYDATLTWEGKEKEKGEFPCPCPQCGKKTLKVEYLTADKKKNEPRFGFHCVCGFDIFA